MTVHCLFTPLLTDTMDQDLQKASITLKGLLDWQAPFRNRTPLSREDIQALLPSHGIRPGDVWYMVEPAQLEAEGLELSMRYTPTIPSKRTAAHTLHKVLSMFHPNVFIQTRFIPRGTVATLRAQNSEFLDIVFRCHAEFQLNRSPLLPFWFTPAQFMGWLIVARNASTVVHFNMSVPSDKKLNVDMEWGSKLLNDNMEVDIGFMPQMKLEKIDKDTSIAPHIVWEEEISLGSALDLLDRKMFPFKEVTYHPIERAVELSLQHQMLLHCVVLWGALDDQSC